MDYGLKMPIHADFLAGILTRKVGHTDLVLGMQSGFISRSVHARLQVCVQRLRFVPPWLTFRHIDRQHFDELIWKAQPMELKTLHNHIMRDTVLDNGNHSPPAAVQIVSMEPPALTLVIVPYPLEHCSDWQLSACSSLGGNWRAAVFTSKSLIASARAVISEDYKTAISTVQLVHLQHIPCCDNGDSMGIRPC